MVCRAALVAITVSTVTACDTAVTHVAADLVDDGAGAAAGAGPEDDCGVCPVGYTPVGNECLWYGGPRNGDFANAGAWQTTGAVVIDEEGAGREGPGAARFLAEAVCDGSGSLQQSFEMPTFECAEPFVLQLFAWSDCAGCLEGGRLEVDLNGGRHVLSLLPLDGASTPLEVCLGERAYGGTVALSVTAESYACLGGARDVLVDDVDVWAAEAKPNMTGAEGLRAFCPAPGTIVNGDLEEGMPGWEPLNDLAEVGLGFGIGSSRGVRLASAGCTGGVMRGTASLPLAERSPRPAVEMWVAGSGKGHVAMRYGEHAVGVVTGASSRRVRLCVPRWAQGITQPLDLALVPHASDCPETGNSYRIDELALVSEPSCEEGVSIFDGSFEQLATAQDASAWSRGGQARVTTAVAHEGSASLELALGPFCEPASARQTITVPAGAPRPAVRFHYRTETGSQGRASSRGEPLEATDGSWREHVSCLEPQSADTPLELDLSLALGVGVCAGTGPRVYFDAVEVLTDADRDCGG